MTPVGVGNGLDTQFSTPNPYVPESLEVDVEGVHQAAVESDPDTGAFTLPYAPRVGAVVSVAYRIAAPLTLNQPIADPGRELGPIPGDDIASIGSANAAGTDSYEYAQDDHVHQGVHQITADGGNLFGNVTLAAGTDITIVRSSQTITISSTGGGGGGSSGWSTFGTDAVQLDTGRIYMYDANGDASIGIDGGVYIQTVGDGIHFQPENDQGVVFDSGEGLVLLGSSVDTTVLANGQIFYRTDSSRIRARINDNWVDIPWVAAMGQSQITSGNTSVTVTHGAGFDPIVPKSILLWPTNNPTNDPGWFWPSDVNDTTFDINVRNNPGASGAFFAWWVVPS